jgi:predicted Zn-dependent protease
MQKRLFAESSGRAGSERRHRHLISMSSRRNQASTSRVTLDDWEDLAPLGEKARQSVAALQESAQTKPLPAKVRNSLAHFHLNMC